MTGEQRTTNDVMCNRKNIFACNLSTFCKNGRKPTNFTAN